MLVCMCEEFGICRRVECECLMLVCEMRGVRHVSNRKGTPLN